MKIVELTEFERHCMPKTTHAGILATRGLDDGPLLALARANGFDVAAGRAAGAVRSAYVRVIAKTGPHTNPTWITCRAVEEAYQRGLLDEIELDQLLQ